MIIRGMWLLILGTGLYFTALFCQRQTDGFSIERITSYFPKNVTWCDSAALSASQSQELREALAQSFRYLGCGGQCFAFVSEDNHYVLKLFKTHFNLFSPITLLKLPFFSQEKRERKLERALFKLRRDFNSYLISGTELKKETGTLFVHLKESGNLNKKVRIYDKLGIAHVLDLDRFAFAVQRKATLAFYHLSSLIETGQTIKAKLAMSALLELVRQRCHKGFKDEDIRVECNCGFIEDQPFFIDMGRFVEDNSRKDAESAQKDMQAVADQLRLWIEKHYPHLTKSFCEIFP